MSIEFTGYSSNSTDNKLVTDEKKNYLEELNSKDQKPTPSSQSTIEQAFSRFKQNQTRLWLVLLTFWPHLFLCFQNKTSKTFSSSQYRENFFYCNIYLIFSLKTLCSQTI